MHLFNLFKAFSANSSSREVQSAGEAEIAIPSPEPSNGSSRKRRRLKRRATKQSTSGWQAQDTTSLSNIGIPDARNGGFRSAPNLLTEASQVQDAQSRSWSPIPTLQRQSTAGAPYGRLRENFSDGGSWESYERNTSPTNSPHYAEPPLDEQIPQSPESPVFGPREQGLFRNEMPYDMDSPLSQPPIPDPQEALSQSEMAYDVASTHSKVLSERSQQARPKHRTISPESRRSDLLYIIPKGLNVIFQDEDGNEITRVGEFNGRQRRISTTIIQDEDGRELHRTSDIENPNAHRGAEPGRHSSRDEEFEYNRSGRRNPRSRSAEVHRSEWSDSERSHELPTIVLIDRSGRQIPM